MICHLNFECPLYFNCEHKDKSESCAIYKDLLKSGAKKFIPYPLRPTDDTPPDQLIMFDPYDLDEPTP